MAIPDVVMLVLVVAVAGAGAGVGARSRTVDIQSFVQPMCTHFVGLQPVSSLD